MKIRDLMLIAVSAAALVATPALAAGGGGDGRVRLFHPGHQHPVSDGCRRESMIRTAAPLPAGCGIPVPLKGDN